jgi:hypothetical protein
VQYFGDPHSAFTPRRASFPDFLPYVVGTLATYASLPATGEPWRTTRLK